MTQPFIYLPAHVILLHLLLLWSITDDDDDCLPNLICVSLVGLLGLFDFQPPRRPTNLRRCHSNVIDLGKRKRRRLERENVSSEEKWTHIRRKRERKWTWRKKIRKWTLNLLLLWKRLARARRRRQISWTTTTTTTRHSLSLSRFRSLITIT